jgi:hypothetical protein
VIFTEPDLKPLQTLTIPEYKTKVKTSNKRRKKYYNKYKGKGVSRSYEDYDGATIPLPKTYKKKVDDGIWDWTSNGYLVDESGDRVVANPRAAGTPNYESLSGNNFSSGYVQPIVRAKLVTALKDFYRPFVQDQLDAFNDEDFPLVVDWECYTTLNRSVFDLSNFWFYYKYLEDCLHEEEDSDGNPVTEIMPDDSIEYVTAPARPTLYPVEEWEDRKFVFRFYTDPRKNIINHPFWND